MEVVLIATPIKYEKVPFLFYNIYTFTYCNMKFCERRSVLLLNKDILHVCIRYFHLMLH